MRSPLWAGHSALASRIAKGEDTVPRAGPVLVELDTLPVGSRRCTVATAQLAAQPVGSSQP